MKMITTTTTVVFTTERGDPIYVLVSNLTSNYNVFIFGCVPHCRRVLLLVSYKCTNYYVKVIYIFIKTRIYICYNNAHEDA